jgi:riboflavin kinase/FMN adenylyltransferase
VPDDRLVCPGHGVYAATVPTPQGRLPAAVSVGVRPTFETGRALLVEAYLLDFEGDLYGQTLRLSFLERLRGERRFDSSDALVAQMHGDVARVREIAGRLPEVA